MLECLGEKWIGVEYKKGRGLFDNKSEKGEENKKRFTGNVGALFSILFV